MKLWLKLIFIGAITFLIILCGVYIFVMFKGKVIVVRELEKITRKKVSVGYFNLTPPLNIRIKDLNIEGMAKVENIYISPSVLNLLIGHIALNTVTITRPELTIERNAGGFSNLIEKATADSGGGAKAPQAAQKKKKPFYLAFRRLNIRDGKVNFFDRTVGNSGIKITVKDLNFNLSNLYSPPFSMITNFDLRGKLPWFEGQEEGKLEAEGWLNFAKKDMQATVNIRGIDGIYLYPYYAQWVDLEKTRIEKATLNFTSNIQGLNNNVTAECHLELSDIVRRPRPADEPAEKAEKIAEAVLDIFRALNEGKVVLDFTIRTKMDHPRFGFGSVKMAVEDKLAQAQNARKIKTEDVFAFPGRALKGVVKGATDLSVAVVDGTFAVANEVKNALKDSFRREKND